MAFHEGWRQREVKLVKEHESERKGSSGGDSDADLTVLGSRPDRPSPMHVSSNLQVVWQNTSDR